MSLTAAKTNAPPALFQWLNRGMLLLALSWAVAPARAQDSASVEYELKAAFLVKFAMFVDWTTNRPNAASAGPFKIGVLGRDPFGSGLDVAVRSERIKARPVEIQRAVQPADLLTCDLVYISQSEQERLDQILTTFAGQGVLTVSDVPQFASRGGMIGFIKLEGRIRFEINTNATERAGLRLNAKLLQLGRPVGSATASIPAP